MIDHLQYNRTKFYPIADNSDKVTANGRNYTAVPKSFTIKQDAHIGTGEAYARNDTNVTCVGAGDDYYFFTGQIRVNYIQGDSGSAYQDFDFGPSSVNGIGQVAKTGIKNVIWGGKHLLAHVYHAVSRFLERR